MQEGASFPEPFDYSCAMLEQSIAWSTLGGTVEAAARGSAAISWKLVCDSIGVYLALTCDPGLKPREVAANGPVHREQ